MSYLHQAAKPRPGAVSAALLGLAMFTGGCMVGPNFAKPPASTAPAWIEAGLANVDTRTPDTRRWWEVFGDPVLSELVDEAYAENLGLRVAGLRVLQAQARRGIAIGRIYPQEQLASGSFTHTVASENAFDTPLVGDRSLDSWQAGFDMVWEIDLWGRFRRGIEAADADLLASVASYDDVLVSLVAEVARTYVLLREVDERLQVARDNVSVQEEGLRVARVRFESGGTSELDVQQAATLLHDTEATIPSLEIFRRQLVDSLCVLLGRPPEELEHVLDGPGRVPDVPVEVTVGVPAELLRRRPDIRAAEQAAAAQSARIGVAAADLLPAFRLSGSVGLSSQQAAELFTGSSFAAAAGPSFEWPILNYGRLVNNVRLQDATFQDLLTQYANAVLVAQQEVEDALIGTIKGRERVERLDDAVRAADHAVELSLIQYREGATDYTAVLNTQQSKLRENDLLVSSRSDLALFLIALNKALGGGWELREGQALVPDEVRQQMQQRTRWGGVLSHEAQERDVDEATRDQEPRPWWKGRAWWPRW